MKHPKGYLDTSRKALDKLHTVTAEELPFEYMMNRLRLFSGFSLDDYQAYTGLNTDTVLPTLLQAKTKGLMEFDGTLWSVSKLGHRYLNDLLEIFL